jgi:hypothetical protein
MGHHMAEITTVNCWVEDRMDSFHLTIQVINRPLGSRLRDLEKYQYPKPSALPLGGTPIHE